ncbi:hypothetical protein B0I35DRAFT_404717 [Stachybotrys elegans]|uniref:Fungal N-terminal domain-containing protein n=1 Tax=Stachybotrys elegans TaxID=80388 RepID=A0A8K0WXA2_9HYPO|nr:hypothetical protein B0I35DRAFT_404717 [Stachybotrys elegans]
MDVPTAIAGILAAGAELVETLTSVGLGVAAVRELKQYRSSLQVLDKTLAHLRAGQLPFPARAAWIRVDYLVAILTDSALALSDFQNAVEQAAAAESPVEPTSSDDDPDAAVQDPLEARIQALSSRTRWLNISLTLILTVLKCHADAEAQTCRKSLDQRMSRLLLANNALSSRMYHTAEPSSRTPRALSHPPSPSTASPYLTLSDVAVASITLPLAPHELYDGNAFYVPEPPQQQQQYQSAGVVNKPSVAPPVAARNSPNPKSFAFRVKRLSPRRRKKDSATADVAPGRGQVASG